MHTQHFLLFFINKSCRTWVHGRMVEQIDGKNERQTDVPYIQTKVCLYPQNALEHHHHATKDYYASVFCSVIVEGEKKRITTFKMYLNLTTLTLQIQFHIYIYTRRNQELMTASVEKVKRWSRVVWSKVVEQEGKRKKMSGHAFKAKNIIKIPEYIQHICCSLMYVSPF